MILEWTNAAAGFGIDNDWYWSHEHLMRRGFAHIGVIVEPNGIHSLLGLKQWNPARYGSLDLTANGKFSNVQTGFELSFSIFSQVAQAAKNPSGVGLLGNLKVRNVVATGHSRSSARLYNYYNRIHPLENVVDGFVFHAAGRRWSARIFRTPAWKLLSETDVILHQAVSPAAGFPVFPDVGGRGSLPRGLGSGQDRQRIGGAGIICLRALKGRLVNLPTGAVCRRAWSRTRCTTG